MTKSATTMLLPPPGGVGGGGGSNNSRPYQFSSDELYELVEDDFTTLNHQLMGEKVSLYTGELTFSQTDLSIPTNLISSINVTRSKQPQMLGTYRIFGDWALDIPRLYGPMYGNYQSGPEKCSSRWFTSRYITGGEAHISDNGPLLGGVDVSALLLKDTGVLPTPKSTLFLNNSNWAITCDKGIYKAHAPNGLVYTFGELVHKLDNGKPSNTLTNAWSDVMLMVTEIKDRFGKKITFNYNAGLITSIESSDGARIQFSYNNSYKVSKVTANGRSWLYSYNNGVLTNVTLPDGTSWTFNLESLYPRNSFPNINDDITEFGSGSIKHPYGASVNYTVQETKHGRSRVSGMKHVSGHYLFKANSGYYSLKSKTITGPTLPRMRWTYSYQENDGAYEGTSTSDTKWVDITDPEGVTKRYTLQRSFDWQEGQVKSVVTRRGSEILERVTNTWSAGVQFGELTGNTWSNVRKDEHRVNLHSVIIQRGQDQYVTQYRNYDKFGLVGKLFESNDFSDNERITKYTYDNNSTYWLIGRPAETLISSGDGVFKSINKNTYYSNSSLYRALLRKVYHYGRLTSNVVNYHTSGKNAGLPAVVNYPGGSFIRLADFKRGTPQTIRRPSATGSGEQASNLEIDNNGWLTRYTDFSGRETRFQYNSVGWRTLIDPLDNHWANTVINYKTTSDGMTRSLTKGSFRETEQLDNFLRVVQSRQQNTSGTSAKRYQVFKYDSNNRKVFASYVTPTPTTNGSTYNYDGLGRLISKSDSERGASYFRHLSSNRILVTDALNRESTFYHRAFGNPATSKVSRIIDPLGHITSIEYNLFGNTTKVRQGAHTEWRVYNSYQQLCKLIRPDTGRQAFGYDASGKLSWKAHGSSVSGSLTSCDSEVNSSDKQSYTYNDLGLLKSHTFGNNTSPFHYQYNEASEVVQINRGEVQQNYIYDSMGNVTQEQTRVDGKIFTVRNEYNNRGDLSFRTIPGVGRFALAPNVFGEATRTGSWTTGATYFANGQLKRMNYGNGFTYDSSVTVDNLIKAYSFRRGSTSLISHALSYDPVKNITRIDDRLSNQYDIQMTYDGLDRLKTVRSSHLGSGKYIYDAVGNLTSLTQGNRALAYNYNANNQLVSVTGSQSRRFVYGPQGEVTNNGLRNFSYNDAGEMVAAGSIKYVYDGHKKRVKTTSSAGTTYSIYDSRGTLVYREKNGVGQSYIHLGGQLVATKRGSEIRYIHTDYQGTRLAESSVSGDIVKRYHYEPYGMQVGNALHTEVGYTGHIYDSDTGLVYMQARYYDPVIGRFYSNDPVGFRDVHSFNRYAYANNNPFKFTDPTGMAPEFIGAIQQELKNYAAMFGYSSVSQANIQGPKDVAATGQLIKKGTRKAAGNISDAATIGAVGSAAVGQVEVAGPLVVIAAVSGFVEAGLSETPQKDLLVEGVVTVTGAKSIGTVAKIATELAGNSKKVQGLIKAADEAGQNEVSEIIKDDEEKH